MKIEEMLKRLQAKYGKYPERRPVGQQRVVSNGKNSGLAARGRKES